MKTIITTLSVLVAAVLVACSGSDPVSPDTQTASVRFYNGNLTAAAMRIGDTKIFDAMAAANVSSRVDIAAATDSIEFRAVDGATNAILARRKAIVKPRPYSFVLFPATSVFNCVRMPEMCVVHEDAAPPTSGRARIRVINATTDGTEFSLNIDGMQLLGNDKLLVRSISNTVDIEAGEHDITLIRTTNEAYSAAYRAVTLQAGTTYTLFLTGTMSFEDKYPFRAALFAEDNTTAPIDLYIPPDVGKYQVVNAVAGLKAFEVKIDGASRPETTNIPFASTSGYVDLEIGTHTTGVFANGTPLIQETRTNATLRSRKTLFVTGSMVPPNIAGLEVVDIVTPLSQSSASVRLINLSPDAPALDFYCVVNGVEAIIDGSAMLAFRQMTSAANGNLQFTELPAGRITILAKKANTQTVVLAPTQITLVPGEVSTLWLGGLSAAPKLYHVKHN
ncbi:MAG: DUF4397 domain-containing protein [Ignavibacteria bacterium]|jgi:hypothetical protein